MEGNRQSPPSPPIPPAEPQLPVLRFGLKQLFWWLTGASVLLAIFVVIPTGLALIAVVLAVGVVTLHILSTALGNRLRDHANQRRVWESGQHGQPEPSLPPSEATIVPVSRRSPLHGRDQPLRRLRIWLTAGAVLGGLLGITMLTILLGKRTSFAGILVGSASTAVVGAWIAFVISSAWSIFREGWHDALRDPNEPAAKSAKQPT